MNVPPRHLPTRALARLAAAGALLLLAACGEAPAADEVAPDTEAPPAAVEAADPAAAAEPGETGPADGPPLGRYVCRQYTTTMGYLSLEAGGRYEVSGVEGRYSYDPRTRAMEWRGGSYDEWGWEGTYEHVTRDAGDGREDEDIIRLEGDGLQIACYRMED